MNTIAARLKHAREVVRDLTQDQLAVLADVSQSTIGNIEAGTRQGKGSLIKIAKALRVSLDWLIDGEGPMEVLPPTPLDVSITGNLSKDLMLAFQQEKDERWVHGSIQHLVKAHYSELSQQNPPPVNLVRTGQIPLLNKETAGMHQQYLDGTKQPPDVHNYHDEKTEGLFAFDVDDDVMEPKIPRGCKAIINVNAATKHGSYVLIHDGSTSYIRRLVVDGPTMLVESPRYPARALTGTIIGVVQELVIWLHDLMGEDQ